MRAVWSGSLSFGLIHIPVKLYSASRERALKFRLLDRHGLYPISYLRVKRGTHQEVPYEDIVRGYEYKKGDYVILSDEDFRRVDAEKTSTIDIIQFSSLKEIDPKYYVKPYYIEPEKKAEKAYVLLRAALKKSGKVAIARFVLREKEHIGAVVADDRALMLHQLRFDDELKPLTGLKIPTKISYSAKELEVALALITHLERHFKAAEYEDTYTKELERVIKAKARGATVALPAEKTPHETDMKDLMKLLKKSLTHAQHA